MAGNSLWNKAVKQAFKMGRKTSKSYSLKNAMFDAKKIYNKGKNVAMSMGKRTRRRSKAKKGNNRRRMYRGGSAASTTAPAAQDGASMIKSLTDKMPSFGGSGSDAMAKPTMSTKM
jgi:hypothetical protein